MPVTFKVVDHPATSWTESKATTPQDFFQSARKGYQGQRIIQSSVSAGILQDRHTSPSKNGFVWSAYHAYSSHHHLTIRPEDVWFAIITQLSFYINANAEELRSFFVAHKGRKELTVVEVGTIESVDFGALARRMTELIHKNVKDAELRDWIMPSFSTTSDTDRVVASVLFMCAMQKYFSYAFQLTCGIPSVTLLGEVSDWQDILARLDKLEQLGDEPTQFAEMLRPILRYMIMSFEEPSSPQVVEFWNKIATRNPMFSGSDYLSGWIGAFCYWDEEGRAKNRRTKEVVLDGVSYPTVDIDEVPIGCGTVPVTVDDNGVIYKCTMLAGSLGIQAFPLAQGEAAAEDRSNTDKPAPETEPPALNVIQPLSGWLMYDNEPAPGFEGTRPQWTFPTDKVDSQQESP
ncbi:hypothetical protein ACJ41O_005935 [Fusarium nematophilum]